VDPSRPATRRDLLDFGTSIFGEMTALALEHHAVNLSQGFPDFDGPDFAREAAVEAIRSGNNQYARSMGLPDLVRAVAAKVEMQCGLKRDPMTEVSVFSGCTEAIFSAFMGLLEPGDEVVLFEPFYDSYPVCAALAGATVRHCTLRWPDFRFDRAELASCFNERTRFVMVNTPHNPTGRVFDRDELGFVADLCRSWNCYAVTDEVYEHITFGPDHVPLATLPGMADRTLTLSSTGKTFSLTGWKVGYAHGPAPMVAAAQAAHQFVTYSTATPFQAAMARALAAPEAFYTQLKAEYLERRDFLVDALGAAGLQVAVPEGTYFAMADIAPFGFQDDVAFAKYLTAEVGVACIPPSFFYAKAPEEGRRLARFAFCKKPETLREAATRLAQWRAKTKGI
jgi:N-succinyldiaminopimelate aminotransferase